MGLDRVEGFELSPHPLLEFESYAHKEDRWPDILTMCILCTTKDYAYPKTLLEIKFCETPWPGGIP